MRVLAIRSALSAKFHDERLTVVQGLVEIEPKTKTMKAIIEKLPESRSRVDRCSGEERDRGSRGEQLAECPHDSCSDT